MEQKIIIKAAMRSDKQLIPLWDERITVNTDSFDCERVVFRNTKHETNVEIVDCIFDIKDKTLSFGIEIDIYPEVDKLSYKKDEVVFVETGYHKLMQTSISDIAYKTYDVEIVRGADLNRHYPKIDHGISIDENSLYVLKYWKPTYVFENGLETDYEHKLYRLTEK